MPKYADIVKDLIGKISRGDYPPNTKLPTMKELCAVYGVSRITIKKAMDELELLGMITRRQGAGTFVKHIQSESSNLAKWPGPTGILGTTSDYERRGKQVRSHIEYFKVETPPPNVMEALNMSQGFVYHIVRSRFVDDHPICVEYTFMPIDLIPGITEDVIHGSIYQYIEGTLGLRIDSAHTIVCATVPTADECEWLGIPRDTPLLEAEQTAFLSDGTCFEYSITRHTKYGPPIRLVRHHETDAIRRETISRQGL